MRCHYRTVLCGVLFALPFSALAQTYEVQNTELSRGATQPPTSAALSSEAPSISINPAGLSYVGSPQLFYTHERSVNRNQVIDGLYLGTSFLQYFGAGVSVEWIRSTTAIDYRKIAYGFSLGVPALSLGTAFNVFSSLEDPDVDRMFSVDLGLTSRLNNYVAVGATVKNVDAPSRGAVALDRLFDFGLAFRPFTDRYALAVDYAFAEQLGFGGGRLTYTANAEVMKGLVLSAGLSHGFQAGQDLLFQVAATLNTENLGLTYAGGSALPGLDHIIQVRLSKQRYRALDMSDGRVVLLDMDDLLAQPSSPALSVLGVREEDPYLRFMRLIDAATRDNTIRGVVLKVSTVNVGMGRSEELRQAVLRLRAAGKRVIAMVLTATDSEYHFASAADKIYAVPEAMLLVDGFVATPTFYGSAMEKLGVHWDVARSGPYKTAPDAFTRNAMSPEQ
jgi:protease IV